MTDVIIGFRNVCEMEPDRPLAEKIAMLEWYAGSLSGPDRMVCALALVSRHGA